MSPAPATRKRLPLVAIVVAVVAVVLVGAVVANAIMNDDSSDNGSGTVEVAPVTVSGQGLPQYSPEGEDPAVGTPAPVLQGQNFQGGSESLGGDSGRPTLAVFVAHWCPHCQAEVPRLVEWREDGTIPDDIDLVAVSTALAAERGNYPPSAWLAEEGWPGRVIVDDAQFSAAGAYGLPSFPYFVALDAEGNVVARARGELDQESVRALVAQLQEG